MLQSKVIWITGASSGIGEALALECAAQGARVAISARRADLLNALAEKIRSSGGTALAVPVDVGSQEQLDQALVVIKSQLGPVDILVANAGTHIFTKPERFNAAEYQMLMDLNFGGMLRSIQTVLPEMLARRSGQIVGMASLAGYRGLPRAAAYGASKAAMIHFLESIRFHLSRFNVAVTIVNPGFVRTPLTDKNDFRMPFLVEAPQAARIIARGIAAHKKELSFPFPFNWVLKVARILPYAIYERVINRLW